MADICSIAADASQRDNLINEWSYGCARLGEGAKLCLLLLTVAGPMYFSARVLPGCPQSEAALQTKPRLCRPSEAALQTKPALPGYARVRW